jgi:hypothetical protein
MLYLPAHAAASTYSYLNSGNQYGSDPLEAGPYSTPPRPWP